MAKLIITHKDIVIKEFDLSKEKVTVGRKASNDIILDDPTVSGVHAAFLHTKDSYVEDMKSTNGIKLNGKKVSKQKLSHGDIVVIGQHEFKYIDETVQDFESTVILSAPHNNNENPPHVTANVVVAKGSKKGETIALNKPYTKLGSGSQVAVIARRGESYFLMPMSDGSQGDSPKLNDSQIGAESMLLSDGDIIEVDTMQVTFKIEK